MFDTMRRDDIDSIKAQPIQKNAPMYDSLKTVQPEPEGDH
jgi:hypothetical protein